MNAKGRSKLNKPSLDLQRALCHELPKLARKAAEAGMPKTAEALQEAVRLVGYEIYSAVARLNDARTKTCPICNGTGLNHGAQPGPGPGYKTIHCECVINNSRDAAREVK